jgi:hypothetical protein
LYYLSLEFHSTKGKVVLGMQDPTTFSWVSPLVTNCRLLGDPFELLDFALDQSQSSLRRATIVPWHAYDIAHFRVAADVTFPRLPGLFSIH